MDKRCILIKSIIGGFFISLGGTCFLSVDNKVLGAFLFSVGLYAICCTGQLLFTGKASYNNSPIELSLILLGNYIGANLGGLIIGFMNNESHMKALSMCNSKINSFGLKTFILAILCNILIYIAVEGYKNSQSLLLILCVSSFILCGFEHSIADIFYFAVARMFSPIHFCFLLVVILGNLAGGQIIRLINKYLTNISIASKEI